MTDAKERMHWSTQLIMCCIGAYIVGALVVFCAMIQVVPQWVGTVGAWMAIGGLGVAVASVLLVEPDRHALEEAVPGYSSLQLRMKVAMALSVVLLCAHIRNILPSWVLIGGTILVVVVTIANGVQFFYRSHRRRSSIS